MMWLVAFLLALGIAFMIALGTSVNGSVVAVTPKLVQTFLISDTFWMVFLVLFGITVMAGEYRHNTVSMSLLLVPKRWQLLITKAVTSFLLGAVVMLIGVLGSLMIWFSMGKKSYSTWNTWIKAIFSSRVGLEVLILILAAGLLGVIGVGLGSLITNQLGATVLVLAWWFIIENIISAIPRTAPAGKWLPYHAFMSFIGAGNLFGNSTHSTIFSFLPQWDGALVLFGYAVVFLSAGLFVVTHKDV
ncbi:MAG: hypothetical protein M1483_05690 [Actinobacteria bacterium]|nr:hypothetical protein [Actinomycetota bacterium]MCL6105102.1 hypothetical protein [Actinomycetota bacterium]